MKSIEEQLKQLKIIMGSEKSIPDYVFKWGKHNGSLLADVYEVDPGYIEWLRGLDTIDDRLKLILSGI